jgi:hypothetical protein
MPAYRLFKLDKLGKFESSDVVTASDDDEASRVVREANYPFDCEIWLLRRLIARIPSSPVPDQ